MSSEQQNVEEEKQKVIAAKIIDVLSEGLCGRNVMLDVTQDFNAIDILMNTVRVLALATELQIDSSRQDKSINDMAKHLYRVTIKDILDGHVEVISRGPNADEAEKMKELLSRTEKGRV